MGTDNAAADATDTEGTADGVGTKADAEGEGADTTTNDEREAKETAERDAERRRQKEADRIAALEAAPQLTAGAILGAADLATEWVLVPGWKGKVLVRALSGKERDYFEGTIVKQRGKVREVNHENIRAKLCQLAMIDPTDTNPDVSKRKTLFTRAQVDALGKKSAADLDIVYDAAARLSGMSEKDVEELAGNSAAGSGDSSPS